MAMYTVCEICSLFAVTWLICGMGIG